jgi:Zn-dependent protease with chaperone function
MSVRTKAHFYALVLLPLVVFPIMHGWRAGGAALLHRYASGQLSLDLPALLSLTCLALGTTFSVSLGRSCIMFLRYRLTKMGRSISRAEAPKLWQVVDHWVDTIGAPRIDRIIVTPDFQAAARVTRRWLVGAREHALQLGEPLLRVLTPEETEVVIVHELAHMRHLDHRGRLMIAVTHTLLATISSPLGQGRGPIRRSVRRIRARFFSEDMQQRRDHENEADRVAAHFVGAEASARAVIRLELGAVRLIRRIKDSTRDDLAGERVDGAIRAVETLASDPDPRDPDLLRMVLERHTLPDDTHPSLSDRLRSIGIDPRDAAIPQAVSESDSAAAAWLGDTPRLGTADRVVNRSAGHAESTSEPEATDLEVMHRLADRAEASLDPSRLGSCLMLHLFLVRARAFTRVDELLDRLAKDAGASAAVLEWVFDRSLSGPGPADAPRTLLALSRLEAVDPARHARALQELADRLALDGRMAEAKATWRLVVRLRTRPLDPETWREASLLPGDLGPVNLDHETFTQIAAALLRDRCITGYRLASVHAALPLQPPRIVLALSAKGSWWDRGTSLRRLQWTLAGVRGFHIELVNFDACSRTVQDRLRVLEMRPPPPAGGMINVAET